MLMETCLVLRECMFMYTRYLVRSLIYIYIYIYIYITEIENSLQQLSFNISIR